MRILFIAASPREGSMSRKLVRRAVDHAARRHDEHEWGVLDLHDEPIDAFRGFDEDYSHATRHAVEQVEAADVLLIGSPVYNGSYSSMLKNLFEHVQVDAIEGRVAGFMLAGGGNKSFLQVRAHLEQLMTYFKVFTLPQAVYGTRDELKRGVPEALDRRIARLVDAAVETTSRLRDAPYEPAPQEEPARANR